MNSSINGHLNFPDIQPKQWQNTHCSDMCACFSKSPVATV